MADQDTNDVYRIIIETIASDNVEGLRELMTAGVDPDIADSQGITALMAAALDGSRKCLECLLQHGADPNLRDFRMNTALFKAAQTRNAACIRVLIQHRANVHLVNDSGDTALNMACLYGHLEAAQALVEGGALVDDVAKYDSIPLPAEANLGRFNVVKDLMDSGAYLSEAGHCKERLLMMPSRTQTIILQRGNNNHSQPPSVFAPINNPEWVIAFVFGVETNPGLHSRNGLLKDTPLICACRSGNIDICQYLLTCGAIPDHENTYGMSALMTAVAGRDLDIVCVLLANGARVDHTNVYGRNALHVAALNGHVEVAKLLLDTRANLESVTCQHDTPLLLAVKNDQPKMVEYLIARGANVLCLDFDGNSLLIIAAAVHDNAYIVSYLLACEHKINWKNEHGFTALIAASLKGHVENVRVLLGAEGIDIEAQNKFGRTALEETCIRKSKKTDILQLLLDAGAKIGNALYFAVARGNHHIVQALLRCGAVPDLFTTPPHVIKGMVAPETNRKLSPMTLALCQGDVALARFLVFNYFLHESDFTTASWDLEFRDYLECSGKQESVAFLDEMFSQPWTLVSQSLLAVSRLVGYGPTRANSITSLCLPLTLQEKLLFKDKSVNINVSKWSAISFENIHSTI